MVKTISIQRIGEDPTITLERLYKYVFRTLPFRMRLFNRGVDEQYLIDNTIEKYLFYHPMWVANTLIIAERPPLAPKILKQHIFVDAISGYRGLLSKTLPLNTVDVNRELLESHQIIEMDEVEKFVKDVQVKQINRSYLLKKPQHEIKELKLVYLPLWRIKVKSKFIDQVFVINANTGESENYIYQKR
ncbi:hypothetical protein M3E13_10685 [Oceanobacillus kimchii]|uniref:Uncharacterized protein n=1 Tax=Oceanobacillus kimchii TaxID=746691 RepID=A0ABQ5TGC8_9BACI|nr:MULTISPECIES: hypothetical protein [Oceanobacillus]MCT1578569.1 hypothetical protein [Oceanobacillus kimchii]MCT2136382.1 hypothetical protein [Oceanobacillus kimchii]GLO65510.1 hypothetical protein MACH08_12940 [Oceanobacillus kimchii]